MRTLVLLAALAIGLNPASAGDIKFKMLQCGNAKSVPPDSDPDPVFQTRIVTTATGEIYIRHFAASGVRYTRNEQYRDLKFWSDEKTDNWSGVSIKRLDWTMVGTIRIEKGRQWVEYIEKLFSGGKLQTTIVSVCRPIPGSKGPSPAF